MKVLVIQGSYKRDGITNALVENFIKGLKSVNPSIEIKVVNLLDLPVEFCKGICSNTSCGRPDGKNIGDCTIKDGVAPVLKDMVDCDRLIFATPIYCLSATALMKRFMERCLPLTKMGGGGPAARNPVRKDKKAAIIVSTGCPYPLNVLLGFTGHSVKVLTWFARFSGAAHVYSIKAGGMEAIEKMRTGFLRKAFLLGEKMGK